jgi:hypothetical protein
MGLNRKRLLTAFYFGNRIIQCDFPLRAFTVVLSRAVTDPAIAGRYGDPLTVRALLRLTDDDKLIALRRSSTLTVNVVMPAEQVFSPTASGSVECQHAMYLCHQAVCCLVKFFVRFVWFEARKL